jgi:hypothetical protein
MEKVFSTTAKAKERAQAARELKHGLRTAAAAAPRPPKSLEDRGLFPLAKLEETKRGYLFRVGRQMNGAYSAGWYDACAVMMRRLRRLVLLEGWGWSGIVNGDDR